MSEAKMSEAKMLAEGIERRRQIMTKADTRTLTPQQETVIELLIAGSNITAAAEAVGVARQTVSEWFNQNAVFQAVLNQRRKQLWGDSAEKLRSLLPRALEVIAEEMQGENRLQAAVHILKAVGLYGLSAPEGSIDPEVIESDQRYKEELKIISDGILRSFK